MKTAFWVGVRLGNILKPDTSPFGIIYEINTGKKCRTIRGDEIECVYAGGYPIGIGVIKERDVETIRFHDPAGMNDEAERVRQELLRIGIHATVTTNVEPIDDGPPEYLVH